MLLFTLAVIIVTCTTEIVSKDVISDNIDGNLELETARLDETNYIVSSSSESDYVGEVLSPDTYKSKADEPEIENTDELYQACAAPARTGTKSISVQNFGIGTVLRFAYNSPGPSAGHWILLNVHSSSGDVLLHFNPRTYVSGPFLVLNSFLGCNWGAEEKPSGYPFSGTVYVVIAVEESGYRITVNGGAFQYLYRHRRPPTSVVSISTDLSYVQYGAVVSSTECEYDNIGKVIYVNGATPASGVCGAGVCAIQLFHAPPSRLSAPTSADIALHFNPRFYLNYVVRNTYSNGGWGPEETAGGMPFTPNTAFKVAIFMQQEQYETAVNGDHFASYKYRLPLTSPVTVLVEPSLLGSSTKVQVV